MHINLSDNNSLVSQYVFELRDPEIQRDSMRFRKNLERIGEIIAYEISKKLEFENKKVKTVLGTADCPVLKEKPVLAAILRAGLPLHQGLLNFFDGAENAFISAYRKHDIKGAFDIKLEYCSCPSLEGKVLIIADPMLATGASMYMTLEALLKFGRPKEIHLVTAIASIQGVEKALSFPEKLTVWSGACDKELNAQAYIVPGLGDAGDLAYGEKIQK